MTQAPFEQLVVEHGEVVLRVCRALLGPAEAEDAWSETFLAALRRYPELPAGSNVKGWLVTIAHNKAVDALRARSRRAVPAADVVERVGAAVDAIDAGLPADGELTRAVATLPPKQRAAVVYRYVADLAYADIADLLGSSPAAARRSAADGIASLRSRYQEETS